MGAGEAKLEPAPESRVPLCDGLLGLEVIRGDHGHVCGMGLDKRAYNAAAKHARYASLRTLRKLIKKCIKRVKSRKAPPGMSAEEGRAYLVRHLVRFAEARGRRIATRLAARQPPSDG